MPVGTLLHFSPLPQIKSKLTSLRFQLAVLPSPVLSSATLTVTNSAKKHSLQPKAFTPVPSSTAVKKPPSQSATFSRYPNVQKVPSYVTLRKRSEIGARWRELRGIMPLSLDTAQKITNLGLDCLVALRKQFREMRELRSGL
jgi:hypothetical protein